MSLKAHFLSSKLGKRPWLCRSETLHGRTGLSSEVSLSLFEGGRPCSYELPQCRYVDPSLLICLLCAFSPVNSIGRELGDLMHTVHSLLISVLSTNPVSCLLCIMLGMSVGDHTSPAPRKLRDTSKLVEKGCFEELSRHLWLVPPHPQQ